VEEGRVSDLTLQRMALAMALVLTSLSVVAWRQGRALGVLSELDQVQSEIGLARSEAGELEREIRVLRSRGRIVADAGARLGLHQPEGQVRVLRVEAR
jgi:cell division protein FtsL